MKIYKVNYESHQCSNQGFSYHSSKEDAFKSLEKFKRDSREDYSPNSGIIIIETQISAKAIIELLNIHAVHNDNG